MNNKKSIIMEHIPGENLNQLIKKSIYLPEILIKIYAKQILLAMTYLHYKNIIHRSALFTSQAFN